MVFPLRVRGKALPDIIKRRNKSTMKKWKTLLKAKK
jgi:hypothetical protein